MKTLAGIVAIAVGALCVAPETASGQIRRWTNQEIDDWIEELEGLSLEALWLGDRSCSTIFSDAGAGYGNARRVRWHSRLIQNTGAKGRWVGLTRTIEVDPYGPTVNETLVHEGLHASGQYTVAQVHSMRDDGTLEDCTEGYMLS